MNPTENPQTMMSFPSAWYVIGRTREFSSARMTTVRRFGRDWIIRKNKAGLWIAQEDLCPHRSAKLSLGKIENDCLTCPFHGFQFDEQGKCSWVPEIKRSAPGLKIQTYPLTDSQGFLWIPWGGPTTPIPWFADLNEKFTYSFSTHDWKKHFTRCVENQLDYAHLPFVHRTTIGKGFDASRRVKFEIEPERIKVDLSENSEQNSYFEFRFGNIWKLNISEQFKQIIAFVPVDQNHTRLYLRTYHSFTQLPLVRSVVAWLSAPFNYVVLNQDHGVVMSQYPNDALQAQDERLFPSDQAIQAFRKWLRSAQQAQPSQEQSMISREGSSPSGL